MKRYVSLLCLAMMSGPVMLGAWERTCFGFERRGELIYRFVSKEESASGPALKEKTILLSEEEAWVHYDRTSWETLGRQIVWPSMRVVPDAARTQEVRMWIGAQHLPDIPVTVELVRDHETAFGERRCPVYEIRLKGSLHDAKQNAEHEPSQVKGISDLSYEGSGYAWICPDERLPVAVLLHLEQRSVPSLWRAVSPDERRERSLHIAWARVP